MDLLSPVLPSTDTELVPARLRQEVPLYTDQDVNALSV
jgi:hypothetical protein